MQLGFALGHQGGGDVELVRGQRREVEVLLGPLLHDQLVDQVIAERQPGDLLQQRLVLLAEDLDVPADVLDVVLQEQNAVGVAGPVRLELVQVEPLQQLAVDPQLQVGHDRAEVRLQLRPADRHGLLRLEGERKGPDPHLGAGVEDGRLPPETSTSPTTQLFRPTFSSWSWPLRSRTTAWCRETSGLARTTVLDGSRPIVTSCAATSTIDRRLSLILLNQIFMPPFQSVLGLRGCKR